MGDQTMVKHYKLAMTAAVVFKDALLFGLFFANAVRAIRDRTRIQWHLGTHESMSELSLSAISTTN
jgi:hypothetical protein